MLQKSATENMFVFRLKQNMIKFNKRGINSSTYTLTLVNYLKTVFCNY